MAYIKGLQDTGPPTPTGTILLVFGVVLIAIIIFLYFCWKKEQYLRRNPKADALLSSSQPGGIRDRRERALKVYEYHREQQMENTLVPSHANFIPTKNSNACNFKLKSSCVGGGCSSGESRVNKKGWNSSRYDESYGPSA